MVRAECRHELLACLRELGVRFIVTARGLQVLPGVYHGIVRLAPDAPVTKQFEGALTNALKVAFADKRSTN